MGRSLEKSGRTVNDAIAAALDELGLSIDDVHVDILNEGKAGLFGLLSGKPAKVRVSELDEDERMPQPGYEGARRGGASVNADLAGDDGEGTDYEDGDDIDADDDQAYGDSDYETADSGTAAGGAVSGDQPDYGEGADGGEDDMGDDDDYSEDPQSGYDNEIGRAITYLENIFDGIRIAVDMDAKANDEGFAISIESEDSGILIGHRGETLDAIQYLVNLYINKGRSKFIRVSVDVENYKKKRESALIRVAGQTADKVVRLRRNFTMDAMNSYERRIVHSALQNHPKVETYSVGEDPNRKVVVTLKNRGGYTPR